MQYILLHLLVKSLLARIENYAFDINNNVYINNDAHPQRLVIQVSNCSKSDGIMELQKVNCVSLE